MHEPTMTKHNPYLVIRNIFRKLRKRALRTLTKILNTNHSRQNL